METKEGEIFEYNGEWYQCLENNSCRCDYCDYGELGDCHKIACASGERSDDKEVYFKQLKKVGEPYTHHCPSGRIIYFQRYKIFNKSYSHNTEYIMRDFNEDGIISIEIKQTKEDMEEKKLNLKPFDIQKAREGKPVCTRDGRKARIICFDRNDLYPIVALIECEDGNEIVGAYSNEGQTEIYEIKGTDLMMLPEKHEGWINVYKGGLLDTKAYDTKKDAFDKASPKDYIATVKIEWEE